MKIRVTLLILAIFIGSICKAEIDTIFFSKSGDTVLFCSVTAFSHNRDSLRHRIIIAAFNHSDTLNIISTFVLLTTKDQSVNSMIPLDTFNKYNLDYNRIKYRRQDNIVRMKIKAKHIKLIKSSIEWYKYDYSADIHLTIKCKSKMIKDETFKYMYSARNKNDIDTSDICTIYYWEKPDKEKFLIYYKIKMDKNKITSFHSKSYQKQYWGYY